jgi:hypothetical protein
MGKGQKIPTGSGIVVTIGSTPMCVVEAAQSGRAVDADAVSDGWEKGRGLLPVTAIHGSVVTTKPVTLHSVVLLWIVKWPPSPVPLAQMGSTTLQCSVLSISMMPALAGVAVVNAVTQAIPEATFRRVRATGLLPSEGPYSRSDRSGCVCGPV